jgi:hypothetical protein
LTICYGSTVELVSRKLGPNLVRPIPQEYIYIYGPTSLNYVHRFRPENFEEEGQSSDGEDVSRLKIRQDLGPENHGTNQEEATRRRDLTSLAQSLNVRAESLEKVVTPMLDQPPTIEPKHGDDNHLSSTSSRPHRHPHLPNGVRPRLALGTVINDLFARNTQPFPSKAMPPYVQEFSLRGSATNSADRSYPPLPPVVTSLAVISASGQAFIPSPDRSAYIHTSKGVDAVSHSNRLVSRRQFLWRRY